jgi:hypothetical protein
MLRGTHVHPARCPFSSTMLLRRPHWRSPGRSGGSTADDHTGIMMSMPPSAPTESRDRAASPKWRFHQLRIFGFGRGGNSG